MDIRYLIVIQKQRTTNVDAVCSSIYESYYCMVFYELYRITPNEFFITFENSVRIANTLLIGLALYTLKRNCSKWNKFHKIKTKLGLFLL